MLIAVQKSKKVITDLFGRLVSRPMANSTGPEVKMVRLSCGRHVENRMGYGGDFAGFSLHLLVAVYSIHCLLFTYYELGVSCSCYIGE